MGWVVVGWVRWNNLSEAVRHPLEQTLWWGGVPYGGIGRVLRTVVWGGVGQCMVGVVVWDCIAWDELWWDKMGCCGELGCGFLLGVGAQVVFRSRRGGVSWDGVCWG